MIHCHLNDNNILLVLDKGMSMKIYDIENKVTTKVENIGFIYEQNIKECGENPESLQFIDKIYLDEQNTPFIFFKNKNIYFYNIESKFWSKFFYFDYDLNLFLGLHDKDFYFRIEERNK
jgi:hypothetical protein